MQTKPRKDLWVFWLRIKWIYNETVFSKRRPYCFTECYFLELFDSVAHILESKEQREMIFISFSLKHSLDVWVQFWWYSNRLLCFYIQLSILKSKVSYVSWTLTNLHMVLGSRDTLETQEWKLRDWMWFPYYAPIHLRQSWENSPTAFILAFFLQVHCEAGCPLELLGAPLLFFPEEKSRFSETSQWWDEWKILIGWHCVWVKTKHCVGIWVFSYVWVGPPIEV